MSDRASSSSSSSPKRKDSATAARKHPSDLRSWFTNLCSRASASASPPHPLTPSRHPPRAQIHSQLLSTLPLEIQRQIYAHVLRSYGTVQHTILLSNNKLTHMRCASPTSHIYFQTQSARNSAWVSYDTAYRKSVQNGREIVPLLLSCRQTYLEFIEIIYSSTAFYLPISAATQLIATVPAPYMALAHLHLSFPLTSPMYLPPRAWPIGFTAASTNPKADEAEWEAFWRAFARLRVRALVVEILDLGVRVPERVLLEPLRKVRAGKDEVVLPWPKGLETSGEFGDAGFVVRRPPEPEVTDLMVQMNIERGNLGVKKERRFWGRLRRR